jgi:hypothetical protein
MEFTLKYRGPLPGGSASGRVEYKHSIRKVFHEQLADYWQRDTRLKGLKPSGFHQAQRSDNFAYDVPRPVQGTQNFFYRTSCRGIEFVPLVIRSGTWSVNFRSTGIDTIRPARFSARMAISTIA